MISIKSATLAVTLLAAVHAATPAGNYLPQTSPTFLPSFPAQPGVITAWPPADASAPLPSGPLSTVTPTLTGYPTMNVVVANAATDPNVMAVMKTIDWTKVPNAPPTTDNMTYPAGDPYCWWTKGGCLTPKVDYIPPDISVCEVPGTWGLTYDDGPMYFWPPTVENSKWAEPNLYDYLLAHDNQKADLFYIGSKLLGAPVAAQRGLNDGHVICVHTWSHPLMTTLTNAEVVAEFYYALRVIKEVLGVTPKCWRPPFGDIDDRVRAIGWQMGMRAIVWDRDTNDWQMNGDNATPLPNHKTYAEVNSTVAGWIDNRAKGNDTKQGHVVLEHELSNATITLTEFWLPTIQKQYKTMPATACNNIAQPYWEEKFVYPIQGKAAVSTNGTSTPTAGNSVSSAPGHSSSLRLTLGVALAALVALAH
ncbi:hypothetical protein BGZ75_000634 [Mortierella antarctica]|nr:hypothetical protein BGZ67_005531 [Mortierella alpina]KAF9987421.1 hypothetical protein BGZ75_000634 [Mortierella antarctica]